MDVIKDIAKSFYHYYKLGEVSFGLQDISVLSMEQAYQCQDAFLKLREMTAINRLDTRLVVQVPRLGSSLVLMNPFTDD